MCCGLTPTIALLSHSRIANQGQPFLLCLSARRRIQRAHGSSQAFAFAEPTILGGHANERHSQHARQSRGQVRHEGDCCSNGFLILQRTVSSRCHRGCCRPFRELFEVEIVRCAAGGPSRTPHLLCGDRSRGLLLVNLQLPRSGRTDTRLPNLRVCVHCEKDAMRCDSDTSMAMPSRCTPVVRVPAIRNADEGEPLQPQTPRPST